MSYIADTVTRQELIRLTFEGKWVALELVNGADLLKVMDIFEALLTEYGIEYKRHENNTED